MPSDILRPMASITLGDLIVLAHRLGMAWREISVGAGTLHAEGSGQSMIASMSRGFGMVLHYTRDEGYEFKFQNQEWNKLLIPRSPADQLGFGILAPVHGLCEQTLELQTDDGSFTAIRGTLSYLQVKQGAQTEIHKTWVQKKPLIGFTDLISLVPPFLPLPECSITTVLRPLPEIRGPLLWREGRAGFRIRLSHEIIRMKKEKNTPPNLGRLEDLLSRYKTGLQRWPKEWGNDGEGKSRRNDRDLELLKYLREEHLFTHMHLAQFPQDVEEPGSLPFRLLVGAHISQAAFAYSQACENIKGPNRKRKFDESIFVPYPMAMDMFEMFQIYVDKLPEMVRHVQDLGAKADPEDIAFAWWVLIYRGLVWYLSVSLVGPNDGSSDGRSGIIVPSSLWGSTVPVYIA